MTTSTDTGRRSDATLDGRIARALVVLGEARIAAARTSSAAALQRVTQAEEALDALLDHRRAFGRESSPPDDAPTPPGRPPWPRPAHPTGGLP